MARYHTDFGDGAARRAVRTSVEHLADDFDELREDVGELAAALSKLARARAAYAGKRVEDISHKLQDDALDGAASLGARVRAQPLTTLGVCAGVGVLIGLALSLQRR